MLAHAPDSEARKKVRDLLGCFLFSGDAVNKKIGVLSGGEKSRVALAKLLLQASNFLILDEPTNHLDMRSKDMLIEALENYDGTLIIVSHDRYFLDSLVSKVIYLKDGKLRTYLGSYADFVEKLEQDLARETAAKATAVSATKSEMPKPSAKAKPPEPKVHKRNLHQLESQIESLEHEKSMLETEMAKADFFKHAQSKSIIEKYGAVSAQLELLYQEWKKTVS
jgi:ATP-binding cassette subfamily F protein 3